MDGDVSQSCARCGREAHTDMATPTDDGGAQGVYLWEQCRVSFVDTP